ncbi:MAG: Ig-like domain-containing protein [Candidatus Spechtbacterales bacterium]|nr:Ig-like domain-containing protein [Candidatus Spechtbacterales bacterium]
MANSPVRFAYTSMLGTKLRVTVLDAENNGVQDIDVVMRDQKAVTNVQQVRTDKEGISEFTLDPGWERHNIILNCPGYTLTEKVRPIKAKG